MMGNLGDGSRFRKLKKSLAKRGDVRNPAALAAAIGRRKYGEERFAALSAMGRERASVERKKARRIKI